MLSRLKYLLIPTLALVLAAGMVIGRISTKLPATASPTSKPSTQPAAWFDEQLNLSADQRKQMEQIWGDVHQSMGKTFDNRRSLDEQRDQSIRELLSDDQKKAYDAIYANYRTKRGEMDKDREKLFADANQRSRAMLNDDQKKRWDALSQEHHGPGGGGRNRGPRSGTQPTSRPFGANNGGPGGPEGFNGFRDGNNDRP